MRPWVLGVLFVAISGSTPAAVMAHPLAPVALFVDQDGTGFDLSIKRARQQPTGAVFRARLPPSCHAVGAVTVNEESSFVEEQQRFECGGVLAESLVGAGFGVHGLSESGVDAVVRVTLEDGRVLRGLLDRSEDTFVVPDRLSTLALAKSFLRSGFTHLLGGLDHILLVFGLVLLLGRARRVLFALTAFTAGHGLSMCAATLGWVALPGRWAEVAIALTLVWLAWEVVRRRDGGPRDSGQRGSGSRDGGQDMKRPYVASLVVGLVHGLGFAAAFSEAGLSGADLGIALGSFHLGIEAGQLLVVVGAWGVMAVARSKREWVREVAGYATGAVAFMWLIERLVVV